MHIRAHFNAISTSFDPGRTCCHCSQQGVLYIFVISNILAVDVRYLHHEMLRRFIYWSGHKKTEAKLVLRSWRPIMDKQVWVSPESSFRRRPTNAGIAEHRKQFQTCREVGEPTFDVHFSLFPPDRFRSSGKKGLFGQSFQRFWFFEFTLNF